MFRKVIVFGLFEMIRKRKEEQGSCPRVWVWPPGWVRYGGVGCHNFISVLEVVHSIFRC